MCRCSDESDQGKAKKQEFLKDNICPDDTESLDEANSQLEEFIEAYGEKAPFKMPDAFQISDLITPRALYDFKRLRNGKLNTLKNLSEMDINMALIEVGDWITETLNKKIIDMEWSKGLLKTHTSIGAIPRHLVFPSVFNLLASLVQLDKCTMYGKLYGTLCIAKMVDNGGLLAVIPEEMGMCADVKRALLQAVDRIDDVIDSVNRMKEEKKGRVGAIDYQFQSLFTMVPAESASKLKVPIRNDIMVEWSDALVQALPPASERQLADGDVDGRIMYTQLLGLAYQVKGFGYSTLGTTSAFPIGITLYELAAHRVPYLIKQLPKLYNSIPLDTDEKVIKTSPAAQKLAMVAFGLFASMRMCFMSMFTKPVKDLDKEMKGVRMQKDYISPVQDHLVNLNQLNSTWAPFASMVMDEHVHNHTKKRVTNVLGRLLNGTAKVDGKVHVNLTERFFLVLMRVLGID